MAGDLKPKFLASTVLLNAGLDALAASSTRLVGYQSAAVDWAAYSGGPPEDFSLSYSFTQGATGAQIGSIDIWLIPALNDTPTWPTAGTTGISGSAGAASFVSANVLYGAGKLVYSQPTDASAGRVYNGAGFSLVELLGGTPVDQFVIFVAHNAQSSTNGLAGSSANFVWLTPVLGQYT
jgi:hypothetical protein